jgi:hypothetical protein
MSGTDSKISRGPLSLRPIEKYTGVSKGKIAFDESLTPTSIQHPLPNVIVCDDKSCQAQSSNSLQPQTVLGVKIPASDGNGQSAAEDTNKSADDKFIVASGPQQHDKTFASNSQPTQNGKQNFVWVNYK